MGVPDVRGRTVLITGGARGIGRAIAEELVAQGAKVAIADRDEPGAVACAAALGSDARAYLLDVRDRPAWNAVAERVERDLGPIDVLVNNAGIMSLGPFLEQSDSVDHLQIDINVHGVINGMKAVLPGMVRRGRGHIVNLASVAGRLGTPWAAVYSATKHAVVGLTEAVAYENKDSGVHFTYVCPGLVDTELIAGAGRPKWPPVATPKEVAVAVSDAIREQQIEVYVPRAGRLSTVLPALMPRRFNVWLARRLNVGDMFKHVDEGERAAYVARATKG